MSESDEVSYNEIEVETKTAAIIVALMSPTTLLAILFGLFVLAVAL